MLAGRGRLILPRSDGKVRIYMCIADNFLLNGAVLPYPGPRHVGQFFICLKNHFFTLVIFSTNI